MNRFYVYGWYLSDGTCFYVGKGTGDRYRERSRRNKYWINIVVQEEREGRPVSVKKLHEGLSEQDALSIEESLIKQLAPKANLTLGGQGPTGYRHTYKALQSTGSAQKALWQDLNTALTWLKSIQGTLTPKRLKPRSALRTKGRSVRKVLARRSLQQSEANLGAKKPKRRFELRC